MELNQIAACATTDEQPQVPCQGLDDSCAGTGWYRAFQGREPLGCHCPGLPQKSGLELLSGAHSRFVNEGDRAPGCVADDVGGGTGWNSLSARRARKIPQADAGSGGVHDVVVAAEQIERTGETVHQHGADGYRDRLNLAVSASADLRIYALQPNGDLPRGHIDHGQGSLVLENQGAAEDPGMRR
jgi:hypothetical protein